MKLPDKVSGWLAEPPSAEVLRSVERVARLDDVVRVALMPDVHLAEQVCVGAVVGTRSCILPAAVGGDIGCGMVAACIGTPTRSLETERCRAILVALAQAVPSLKHPTRRALPVELERARLSAPGLQRVLERDGAVEFGTLGRGNHFLELQSDEEDALWIMVHSGSRALGPAIRDHHTRGARGLVALPADSEAGRAFLADHEIALGFAAASRQRMLETATTVIGETLGTGPAGSFVSCVHDFVRREQHAGEWVWVHRKGAIAAGLGEPGVIPGSMGTDSFVVSGRGEPRSLGSSSHGAGRALTRSHARQSVSRARLEQEMRGVWFDADLSDRLRDEAPSAYKPIARVMRAQRELTRIERRLRPRLVYKGT